MTYRIIAAIGGAVLGLAVMSVSASASTSPPGGGDCHADQVQFFKGLAGTHSAEATADFFGVTLRQGQEAISTFCGKS